MIPRRPSNGDVAVDPGGPKSRRHARTGASREIRTHARDRLRHLYEVSKLLTAFDDVEETVRAVLSNMAHTLPLRSAVLLLGSSDGVRTFVWKTRGIREGSLRLAIENARIAYPYFVGPVTHVSRESATPVHELAAGCVDEPLGKQDASDGFILLPLTVGRRPIFGALQVEGAERFDESDLVFVNAVVNQLAIAIDRNAAIEAAQYAEEAKFRAAEAKRVSAEQAAREQSFLADLSAGLASSRHYRSTLATAARLAVPSFADVCVIDELADDGELVRIEVAAADEQGTALAEVLRTLAPQRGSNAAQAQALATGRPVLVADVDRRSSKEGAHDRAQEEVMRAAGVLSAIAVPLVAHERPLGVLSFVTAGSARRYDAADIGLAVEVARRIAMAMENAQLHERAERAVEQRQDVLAMVSHDLRNPLSTILMLTQLHLQMPSADDRKGDREKMDLIRRSAERMNSMIKDLLDVSSIDAGHLSINVQPNALGAILSEAMDVLGPVAQTKGIRVDALLVGDLMVLCDGARILQVLLNLIGNAIKFTPSGGSVRVSAEAQPAAVLVTVSDTGSGIAPGRLAHIFERYWQARETASKGTGLGLYISKGIVEAHGGSIGAESTVGSGSRVFFSLPMHPKPAAPPSYESLPSS